MRLFISRVVTGKTASVVVVLASCGFRCCRCRCCDKLITLLLLILLLTILQMSHPTNTKHPQPSLTNQHINPILPLPLHLNQSLLILNFHLIPHPVNSCLYSYQFLLHLHLPCQPVLLILIL